MKNIAIVLAGGQGLRMGSDTPKQFLNIDNLPMIVKTISAFNAVKAIDFILVVCLKDYIPEMEKLVKEYNLNKVRYIVEGGSTRQESVFKGLTKLKQEKVDGGDIVLIHDGARPFVSEKIILDNIEACDKHYAVNTVIKVTDSVLISKDGEYVNRYLDRDELYRCQTPQTFRLDIIYGAHEDAIKDGIVNATDDASLLIRFNKPVHLVLGDPSNKKITNPQDL